MLNIRPRGSWGKRQEGALTGFGVPATGRAIPLSCLFGDPCVQGAWGVRGGPSRPAQLGLILILLGGAEAAGLQQRREPAARTQGWTGLPLQEAGLGCREALAAERGASSEATALFTPAPQT